MKSVRFGLLVLILLLTALSCSPEDQTEISGSPHIIAHPQYSKSDAIDGSGWEVGRTVTLEIDDPSNGTGADYTNSQAAQLTDAEGITVQFQLGQDWDLEPGHMIILSDGEITVQHVVQNLTVDAVDIDSDTISGSAKPGSEVMVWIEAPYFHDLVVVPDDSGNWQADFSGIADIIDSSTGAAAQNDIPPVGSSHTRFNWTFGHLHIEASINEHWIGFYNFRSFDSLTFNVVSSPGGDILYEGTLETDDIGSAMFENRDKIFLLEPGTIITAQENATGREAVLEMRYLTVEEFDPEMNTIQGWAGAGETVFVYAYDTKNESEFILEVTTDKDGQWAVEFEDDLGENNEVYVRIFDEEHDEIAFRWVSD